MMYRPLEYNQGADDRIIPIFLFKHFKYKKNYLTPNSDPPMY